MTLEPKDLGQHVINYGKAYPGEVYTANRPGGSSVQLVTFNYGGDAPVTAWKTCAQVDTDGAPLVGDLANSKKVYGATYRPDTTRFGPGNAYVNALTIPYIVLPMYNHNNVAVGDFGVVINLNATNGMPKMTYVIYGDRGPEGVIGEASARVHKILFNNTNYNSGHDAQDLVYIMFPGSAAKYGFGNGTRIPTEDEIIRIADQYYTQLDTFING